LGKIFLLYYKKYILISGKYQLHPASATTGCSNGITDTHSKKRRRITKKEKSRYGDEFLVAAVLTPPI
jgi:hypothetical protein